MTDDPVVYKEVCTIGTQTDDNGCNNGCTSMYVNVVHVIHSTGESIQVVLDDSRGIEADVDNGLYDGGTEETDKDMEGIKILEETDADHFDGGRIKEGNCHRKKSVAIINDANEDRDRGTKNFEKITSEGNSISTAQDKIIQLQKGYLKLNNEDENIECFHCKKKFTHKNNLKRHLRIHSGEKPFQCSLCKKKFSRNHDLKRHLRLHNGEKPFECSHCAKRFTAKSNLNAHIRKYSGVKPFECSYCKKKFPRKHDLTRHLRIHNGEKPFECSLCIKKFAEQTNLKSHMRTHTGEKPFECSNCDRKFAAKKSLNYHIKTHTASCEEEYSYG